MPTDEMKEKEDKKKQKRRDYADDYRTVLILDESVKNDRNIPASTDESANDGKRAGES